VLDIFIPSLGGPLLFHRATLLDILVAGIPPDRVHFKKRLSSYSEDSSGEVTLHFADGTTATADILVGCDGIRSSVRRHMYTTFASDTGISLEECVDKYVEPAWSGTVAYRTLIPTEELRKVNPEHFVFKGPHVVRLWLPYEHISVYLCLVATSVSERIRYVPSPAGTVIGGAELSMCSTS
jgi:2-polyprenyl-6-methoxyphenol hydroxylase-like FAD-dependent oxidoreductase